MKKLTRSQKIKGWVFLITVMASPIAFGGIAFVLTGGLLGPEFMESGYTAAGAIAYTIIWFLAWGAMIDREWQMYSPV